MYLDNEITEFNYQIHNILTKILSKSLTEKLVDYYTDKLFNIVYFNLDLNLNKHRQIMELFVKQYPTHIETNLVISGLSHQGLYEHLLKSRSVILHQWFANKINDKRLGIFLNLKLTDQSCKSCLSSIPKKYFLLNKILNKVVLRIYDMRRKNIPVNVPKLQENQYLFSHILAKY